MSGTVVDQIQWLVRKPVKTQPGGPSGYRVLGPYLTDQVRSMLQEGMLEADDEIAPENSYWFGLNEMVEVKRFLGIDQVVVARSQNADRETTQPDLETTQPDLNVADENTPPGIEPGSLEGGPISPDSTGIITIKRPAAAKPQAPAAQTAPQKPGAPARKPAPAAAPSAEELANRFQRVAPATPSAYANPMDDVQPKQILGLEKGQFWSLLIIAGIILSILGIIWVLKSLRALPV